MSRSVQFRTLPAFGASEREVAEVVRGIMDGKTNNSGLLTLATGNATTTTLYDERIGFESVILFAPMSDAAEADTAPYGAFQDSTDQTAANTTTAYAVAFNTTDYSSGVYLSNSSHLNVRNYGVYNVQFSIQLKNTTNDTQDVDIWLRKNGSDIASSNSRFGMPTRKSSGDPSHIIAALNFFVELQANDYIQIMWRPSNVGASIESYGTDVNPTRPAVPGVIATMNYIAPAATSNVYVSSQQRGQATVTHWANNVANKTYGYVIIG